jgi:hypothetical protein
MFACKTVGSFVFGHHNSRLPCFTLFKNILIYKHVFNKLQNNMARHNELPRSKLRGIGGMGTIIMPPHPALSLKGRGNTVTPKQSFEESID